MTQGRFEDGFPRIMLELPGRHGDSFAVDFIVDTGFAGDLAVPASVAAQVSADYVKEELVSLADGSLRRTPLFMVEIEWEDETRLVELSVLRESNALLGIGLLRERLLQIEMTDGGEVSVEPL